MACVGVALALCTRSMHELDGSVGMLPQENFEFLDQHFWCIFKGKGEASGCQLYLSMIQTHSTQS